MAIEELVAVLPPPSQPLEVGSLEQWKQVEATLHMQFPPDLYDFCVQYGSGLIAGITVYNPFSPAYESAVNRMLAIFRGLRNDLSEGSVPFPLFPERPGLFPVGKEDNGGTMFWL